MYKGLKVWKRTDKHSVEIKEWKQGSVQCYVNANSALNHIVFICSICIFVASSLSKISSKDRTISKCSRISFRSLIRSLSSRFFERFTSCRKSTTFPFAMTRSPSLICAGSDAELFFLLCFHCLRFGVCGVFGIIRWPRFGCTTGAESLVAILTDWARTASWKLPLKST